MKYMRKSAAITGQEVTGRSAGRCAMRCLVSRDSLRDAEKETGG